MPSSKHLKAPKITCNHLTIVSGSGSNKKDDKVKKFVISGPSSSKVKEEKVKKHKVVEERESKKEEKPKKEKKEKKERRKRGRRKRGRRKRGRRKRGRRKRGRRKRGRRKRGRRSLKKPISPKRRRNRVAGQQKWQEERVVRTHRNPSPDVYANAIS
jgi:hypothetical protein